ncbi:MAG: DUF2807 domain-containing protein [Treponema sp.]|nr:DUF2807 domain-containing protein [Treponema sp.]
MKKSVLFAVIIITAVTFAGAAGIHAGNGNIVSTETILQPFEKIHSGSTAEIRYYASQDYRTVITVDSNIQRCIELKVKNGTLIIKHKHWHWCFPKKYTVEIYCPVLTGVHISGSGSFTGIDKITAPSFHINVSGSGKIDGTVECDNYSIAISGSGKITNNLVCNSMSADISGSGRITVTGNGNDVSIRISGSGKFNGIEFQSNKTTARISGSGDLEIWALESLRANVSGSGMITYRGNPQVDFNSSGSGRIKREEQNG